MTLVNPCRILTFAVCGGMVANSEFHQHASMDDSGDIASLLDDGAVTYRSL